MSNPQIWRGTNPSGDDGMETPHPPHPRDGSGSVSQGLAEQGHQELDLHGKCHGFQSWTGQSTLIINGPVACEVIMGHVIVTESAPQVIGGAELYAVLHCEPHVQAQGRIDKCISQGPGHHDGEPPQLLHVSQEKDGVIMRDDVLQIQHTRPGNITGIYNLRDVY